MIAHHVSGCDICCSKITPGNHVQIHPIYGWVHSNCNQSQLRQDRQRRIQAIEAKKRIVQLNLFK